MRPRFTLAEAREAARAVRPAVLTVPEQQAIARGELPEPPANLVVRAGHAPLPPAAWAALGWLVLCAAIAARFGWWLLPAGLGLGTLLAGLGVMLRDAVASWAVAYWTPNSGAEGSTPPPPADR